MVKNIYQNILHNKIPVHRFSLVIHLFKLAYMNCETFYTFVVYFLHYLTQDLVWNHYLITCIPPTVDLCLACGMWSVVKIIVSFVANVRSSQLTWLTSARSVDWLNVCLMGYATLTSWLFPHQASNCLGYVCVKFQVFAPALLTVFLCLQVC